MVYIPTLGASTLDEYIAKLQALKAEHGGNCRVMTSGGDYPESAHTPWYVTKDRANGYLPEGVICLD